MFLIDKHSLILLSLQMLIPITLTLVVMGLYIVIGGIIYECWEDSWSFVDAVYFGFVTLATIGFGDFVPASE